MKQLILFMIILFLICCLSFHAIHVLIFCATFHPPISLVLLLYTMYIYMLVREQQSEGSPPRCLHHPSNNNIIIVEVA